MIEKPSGVLEDMVAAVMQYSECYSPRRFVRFYGTLEGRRHVDRASPANVGKDGFADGLIVVGL